MIRKITNDDLLEISIIEKAIFKTPYTLDMLKSSMNASTFFALVDSDKEIKGYVIASKVLDEVNIDRVAVKEEYRRQKIATNLIVGLEEELKKQGSKIFYLEVRKSNVSAINLYKSMGYEEIAIRKNYYENTEDAIIMEKRFRWVIKIKIGNIVTIVKGKGKPILLLHGYLSCKESFNYQIEFLSKFRKVIAPDLSGFGESGKLESPYSLGDYKDEVLNILKYLNVERYDVLAHSFGGRIAIKLASENNNIDKIILTGAAGLKPRRKLSYYIKVYVYKFLKLFVSEQKLKNFGSTEYKTLDSVMKKSYIKIVNEHLDSKLKLIENEVLIIFGDGDKETPVYMAKKLAKNIKRSSVYIMKGCGHFCFIDKPLYFNTLIKEFLLC